MSAHRYWRVNVTLCNGRNFVGCAEMEMFTAVGGSDVCSGGTALQSSNFGGGPAANAFDNSGSTNWYSGNGALPEYLGYDFGSGNDKDIVGFSWVPRNDGFANSDAPNTGTLQYSDDGSTWTTRFSFSGQSGWSIAEKRNFYDPALPIDCTVTTSNAQSTLCGDLSNHHRYWRMYVTAVAGKSDGSFGLRELQMREAVGGTDVITGSHTVTADSEFGGLPVSNAVDDNTGTTYASGTGGLPHWVKVDFGTGKNIAEVAWMPRAGSDADQAPIDFTIDYSDDNSSWTTKFTAKGLANQDVFSTTLTTLSADGGYGGAVRAQAWRILPSANGGGSVYAASNIEFRNAAGADMTGSGRGSPIGGSSYGSEANAGVAAAFDDVSSTKWNSTGANSSGWVGWVFNEAVDVRGVAMSSRTDNSANQTPTAFKLQYWDGSAWQDSGLSVSGLSWSLSETKTWDVPGVGTSNASTIAAVGAVTSPSGTYTDSLDRGHHGQPLANIVPTWRSYGVGSLDLAHHGEPFGSLALTVTSITSTVTTSQAQTAAATVGVSSDATVTTSQAQTTAATLSAVGAGEVQVTTSSATSAAATASVGVDVAVATSSATSAAATAGVSADATATTSSASTTAGTLSKPWTVVRNATAMNWPGPGIDISGPSTLSLGPVADGNSVIVQVSYYLFDSNGNSNHANVLTDSSGNTYTLVDEYRPYEASFASNQHSMLTYVANDVVGDASDLVVSFEVNFITPVTGGNFTLMSLYGVEVNAEGTPLAKDVSKTASVFGFNSGAAVSSGSFSTTAAGLIAVHRYDPIYTTLSGARFSAGYTELTPASYEYNPGDPAAYPSDAAYRVTEGALSGTTVTYTPGNANGSVNIQAVGFKAGSTTDATASTSSASSVAATAALSWDVSVTTSNASSVAAVADVQAAPGTVVTSSASTVAAEAGVSVDTTAATSSATTAAAQATPVSDLVASTASASSAAATGIVAWDVQVATSAASTSAAVATPDSPVSSATSTASTAAAQLGAETRFTSATQTAQTAAGAANVSSDMSVVTSSASRVVAAVLVIGDLAGSTSSASSQSGVLVGRVSGAVTTSTASTAAAVASSNTDFNAATRTASTVRANAEIELVNGVTTRTASTVAAEASVSVDMSVTTRSASRAAAAAGVSLDASVGTACATKAEAIALAEWIISVQTASASSVAAVVDNVTRANVATASATTAAAQVGVSVDCTVATGSFARMEYGRLDVEQGMSVATSSVSSTLLAVADVYDTPTPWDVVAELRLLPAVGGGVEIQPAVGAASRIFPAVDGDADARPL